MPLTIASNLSSYTLAAGEPFVLEIQLLDSSGRGTDITDTAMYLSFYYGGPRALVLDYNGGVAQYQGERFADETGEFFRFAFDGRFSESMYGKPGVKVELSRRFLNGRKVIATGALVVLASAAALPSLSGEEIADTAVRITIKANPTFGGPPIISIQVIPFNDDATPIPVLQPLTLSSTDFQRGVTETVDILGATDGSALSSTTLPVGFSLNGDERKLSFNGSGSGDASPTITLIESLDGAASSPRSTPFQLTIGAGSQQASVFGNGSWDDSAAWNDTDTWKDVA